MPANAQDAMAFAMPAFNHLSDQDITDVINFIRGAWINQAPPIGERATSGTSANSWPARSRTSSPEANNEQETETRIAAGRAGGLRRLAGRRGRCAGHTGSPAADRQAPARTFPVLDKDGKRLPDYTIPSDTDIARQPNAEQINYGKRLLNETRRLLPNNTGASMNCNSCHVQQGKKPMGALYINTVNSFPQFNPRANRVVTLEDRINGCFMRSMNGKPLAKDSRPRCRP